jgi:hypothetical protein
MRPTRSALVAAATVLLALHPFTHAMAQAYPTKP